MRDSDTVAGLDKGLVGCQSQEKERLDSTAKHASCFGKVFRLCNWRSQHSQECQLNVGRGASFWVPVLSSSHGFGQAISFWEAVQPRDRLPGLDKNLYIIGAANGLTSISESRCLANARTGLPNKLRRGAPEVAEVHDAACTG